MLEFHAVLWKKLRILEVLPETLLVPLVIGESESLEVDIADDEVLFRPSLPSSLSFICSPSSCSRSTCHCSNCCDSSTFCWIASSSWELICMTAIRSLAKSISAEFFLLTAASRTSQALRISSSLLREVSDKS